MFLFAFHFPQSAHAGAVAHCRASPIVVRGNNNNKKKTETASINLPFL